MQSITRRVLLSVLVLGAAAVGSSAGGSSALAHPPRRAFGLDLLTESGRKLRRYAHAGTWFILGTPGERYAVRVTNPTGERVEAVVSVDGRDAISGRRGNYTTERGYIVPPYGSVLIEGFRSSASEVRAFRFIAAAASYSARMGTPENVGIIGVAIFKERPRPVAPARAVQAQEAAAPEWEPQHETRAPAAPRKSTGNSSGELPARAPEAPSRTRAPASSSEEWADRSRIGTEYGEVREHRAREVPFVRRGARPDAVLSLRYDDADGLTARGIDLYPEPRPAVRSEPPQAFPDSRQDPRFAPPPP